MSTYNAYFHEAIKILELFSSKEKALSGTMCKGYLPMVNVLKFEHFIPFFFGLIFAFFQLFLKILSGIANSADPDQTAPLFWVYTVCICNFVRQFGV